MSAAAALPWVAAAFLSASLFSHTVALRLILLFAATALAVFVIVRERGTRRVLPPIWIPFALWAAWAALSVIWSVEPERTVKEWRNEIFYCGLALWVCFIAAQSRNSVRAFLSCVAVAAAAVMVIGLRDFWISWDRYLEGLAGGPGDHSSALLTLMPCLAMAGWYARRAQISLRVQMVIVILSVLLVFSAYATLNRTIWLGFIVQTALLGLLLLSRRTPPSFWNKRTKIVAGASAVLMVAATAGALLTVQAEREAIGGTTLGGDHRLLLWPEIIDHIEERPVTGYGFGRGLLRKPLRAEFGVLDGQLWHAHNIFLEALLQLGAPGLAFLLLWLASLLLAGWRATGDVDEWRAACGIALLGVVAGMLVRNMTDTLFVRQNALLFWGITGLLLAWALRPPHSRIPGSTA